MNTTTISGKQHLHLHLEGSQERGWEGGALASAPVCALLPQWDACEAAVDLSSLCARGKGKIIITDP